MKTVFANTVFLFCILFLMKTVSVVASDHVLSFLKSLLPEHFFSSRLIYTYSLYASFAKRSLCLSNSLHRVERSASHISTNLRSQKASTANSTPSDEEMAAENHDTSVSTDGNTSDTSDIAEAEFHERCEDVSGDNVGIDTTIAPWPRFDASQPVFEHFNRFFFATAKLMEDVNILSPAWCGPWFGRPGNYFSDAKQALKDIFPFVPIEHINAIWQTYRQFAATFYVLDAGLRSIYRRFGVANHLELRRLANQRDAGLNAIFQFRSPIPVFTVDNPDELLCQTHTLQLIGASGEFKRRAGQVSGLEKITSVLQDETVDTNLRLECEWLAFHMSTATLRRQIDNDARGNIPENLRPCFPINQLPNAGWLFAFCFAREIGPDGVWPDDTRIQCLTCLRNGRYTTVSRPNGQTDRIMRHLQTYHPAVYTEVIVLSVMAGRAYANAE